MLCSVRKIDFFVNFVLEILILKYHFKQKNYVKDSRDSD